MSTMYHHHLIQNVDETHYSLEISRDIRAPLHLSLAELREAFPPVTLLAVAPGNFRPGRAPVVEWTGTSLGAVLLRAGLRPDPVHPLHVVFSALEQGALLGQPETQHVSLPLAQALAVGVILAYAQNGQPLTPAQGFPLRAVAQADGARRHIKWLRRISLHAQPVEHRL